MNDYLRESLSYFGIYRKLLFAKKGFLPERVGYGPDKDQYFLYYEPRKATSDKIIFWVHMAEDGMRAIPSFLTTSGNLSPLRDIG